MGLRYIFLIEERRGGDYRVWGRIGVSKKGGEGEGEEGWMLHWVY